MNPAVTIRDATLDDVSGIQHVAHDTYHAAYSEYVDPDGLDAQLEEWYSVDGVQNRVIRAGSTLLVADHETDGVVGYASGGPTPTSNDTDDTDDTDGSDDADDPPRTQAMLYTCYVHPDHWNERIGHALLTTIEDRLRDQGFQTMQIPVLAANDRATQFYADHGYEPTGTDTADFAGRELDETILENTL